MLKSEKDAVRASAQSTRGCRSRNAHILPGLTPWTRCASPSPATRNSGNGGARPLFARSSVVFKDSGTLNDDVVHLHLEHRVVQRLLGRFTAQGFVHNDLSRACLAQSADPVRRVILLGRLCLYGAGAARL